MSRRIEPQEFERALVEVKDLADLDGPVTERLTECGFESRGEYGITGQSTSAQGQDKAAYQAGKTEFIAQWRRQQGRNGGAGSGKNARSQFAQQEPWRGLAMTKVHMILAIAVLTTGAAAAPITTRSLDFASQEGAVEAAIRAVHRRMQVSAGQLDAAALYANVLDTSTPPIAEDGILLGSHATALAATQSGLSALSRLSYEYAHESITLLSKDAALWVADGTVNATLQDGREITAPFAETIVFLMKDGEWKVLHAHRSAPNAR